MTSDEMQNDAAAVVEAVAATEGEAQIDPETGWNRLMVEQIVRDVNIAHEINSRIWTLKIYLGFPILNIGSLNFVARGKNDSTLFLIDRASLTADQREVIESFNTTSESRSNPTFAVVEIPLESTEAGLTALADAHLSAIKETAGRWKINHRWRWYRDEDRKQIERFAEVSIPEPGFMQELHDLQKEQPSPPISDMYSQAMIEQMAASILAAHELGASCWSLFEAAKRIVLNVGQETVGGSNKAGTYDFVVDRELLTPEQDEWASVHLKPKPTDQYPSLLFLQLPDDTESDRLSDLQEAHISALTKLTKVFKKATLWQLHQEHFAEQIQFVTGMTLPEPGYLPELRKLRASEGEQAVRYWKISPGANAVHWDQFKEKSVIAVHWLDDPKDLRQLPKEKAEFVAAINGYPGATPQAANALWEFAHRIAPGDQVLAYGNKTVLGFGTVTGEYESVQDDFHFPHRRAVAWGSVEPRSITKLSDSLQRKLQRNATTIELSEAEYAEATENISLVAIDPLSHVRGHFASLGLHYTDAQIATFYTALQTKGFVVLSGISGTGKSKIAQHFVELMPVAKASIAAVAQEPRAADGFQGEWIVRTIPSYLPEGDALILPRKQFGSYPTPGVSETAGVRVNFDGVESDCLLRRNDNPARQVIDLVFKGDVLQRVRELREGDEVLIKVHLSEDESRIDLIEMKQGTLSGPTSVQHGSSTRQRNHLFLSVRPDWRDSTSLLGYFNPLTGQYQWTDFLHFILRAVESYEAGDGLAWFVILDEMNLAHVEYYFADLLSVIESGRGEDGFSKEPLRTSYPETGEDDEVPPREIFLPPSLYVIGTVNMDETTHAFSPKVLDRAFTIELTEVDFTNFPPTSVVGNSAIEDAGKPAMLAAFTRGGQFARIDKEEVAAAVVAHPEIRDHLQSLNDLLKRNRFHFGYRIFDEIAQYLFNNDRNEMMTFDEAFDQAVFMKVLPKFTGSRSRLRSPLLSLLAWAIDPGLPLTKETVAEFDTHMAATSEMLQTRVDDAALPHVAGRALQMLETLETDGFVSFG